MNRIFFLGFFLISLSSLFAQDRFIHVDQFGYYSTATKVAVLSDPQIGFNANESYTPFSTIYVIDNSTNEVVFSAAPSVWSGGSTDHLSGDRGWWFDFSDFTTEGTYYINDPVNNISSAVFEINENPYFEVLQAATKMFYYNRCNMDKVEPYAGANWTDGMNFDKALQDYNCRYIYDPSNANLEKDLSGGWFDAGDYNKYVTFTYTVIHNLLQAYQATPSLFADNWNLPESGNGLPDLLDEVKWELDWLIKMTNEDGSVHIKMGSQNYAENTASPPSANTDQRFYGPTCTSASATIASTFAHAALVFQEFPAYASYVEELETIARNCFDYTMPFLLNGTLETDCDDGSIVAGDADMSVPVQREVLISAATYLYALTGDQVYNDYVIEHAPLTEPVDGGFWGAYKLSLYDALLLYTTLDGAEESLISNIRSTFYNSVGNNWNGYYGMVNLGLYRDFMPEWSYHWGSNNAKAGYGCLNLLIPTYDIFGQAEDYYQRAEEYVHAFHGVNPMGQVALSNMYPYGADHSANEIYHTWFNDGTPYDHALNSELGPAPGFVVGGANSNFSVEWLSPPSGQPAAKSYLDFNTGFYGLKIAV